MTTTTDEVRSDELRNTFDERRASLSASLRTSLERQFTAHEAARAALLEEERAAEREARARLLDEARTSGLLDLTPEANRLATLARQRAADLRAPIGELLTLARALDVEVERIAESRQLGREVRHTLKFETPACEEVLDGVTFFGACVEAFESGGRMPTWDEWRRPFVED